MLCRTEEMHEFELDMHRIHIKLIIIIDMILDDQDFNIFISTNLSLSWWQLIKKRPEII